MGVYPVYKKGYAGYSEKIWKTSKIRNKYQNMWL
jgi:hypothetical protein